MRACNGKPAWLNKKIDLKKCSFLKELFLDLRLRTVCQEALCPNISECFSAKRATFLILGKICTRSCRFCAVKKGPPQELDPREPQRIAEAVKRLGLKHVVITSPCRDDLADGGSQAYQKTIQAIRGKTDDIIIEVLIPDFKGDFAALQNLIEVQPEIIGHNLETVPRLFADVRPQANYFRSLEVLRFVKNLNSQINTKSGLMLGLGEQESEVLRVLEDLRAMGCDFLSLGQYLSPSCQHFPVKEYITPERFAYLQACALNLGFRYVLSGPYVRSSYLSENYLGGV